MPVRFSIRPPRPYSLGLTASRFTRFPEVVDRFDGKTYRRLLRAGREAVLLSVAQRGGAERAVLEVALEGPGADSPAASVAARRLLGRSLGAGTDVEAFYRACAADPLLAASIRDFRGLRIVGFPSPDSGSSPRTCVWPTSASCSAQGYRRRNPGCPHTD